MAAVRSLVQDHLADAATELAEPDAMALLDAAGLQTLPTEVVRTRGRGGGGGAVDGLPRRAEGRRAETAWPRRPRRASPSTWRARTRCGARGPGWRSPSGGLVPALVQPMVGPGVDVAVVVRDHPAVGPVLSLGPGGAAAALDTAADVRVLPLSDLEALRLVASSRLAPLLDDQGRRALEATLLRLAALVEDVPEIGELVLNPVIVRDGTAVICQAVATVAADRARPAPAGAPRLIGQRGRPSTRSPRMLRRICVVPPMIVYAGA